MSILDALPGIAAGAFGGLFRAGLLIKFTPGASDGRGGTLPPTAGGLYACKALVESYSDIRQAMAQIPDTDRKVTVLGATLPAGIVPATGDQITVENRTYTVITVNRDPAGATYELQAR